MGRGDGRGRGQGEGSGRGQGQGQGGDTVTNVAVGSAVATGFTVIMCLCGIPMMVLGAVFVRIDSG